MFAKLAPPHNTINRIEALEAKVKELADRPVPVPVPVEAPKQSNDVDTSMLVKLDDFNDLKKRVIWLEDDGKRQDIEIDELKRKVAALSSLPPPPEQKGNETHVT